jgi:hypothetical protein
MESPLQSLGPPVAINSAGKFCARVETSRLAMHIFELRSRTLHAFSMPRDGADRERVARHACVAPEPLQIGLGPVLSACATIDILIDWMGGERHVPVLLESGRAPADSPMHGQLPGPIADSDEFFDAPGQIEPDAAKLVEELNRRPQNLRG